MSLQDSQIPADHGAETSGDHGAQTASDQGIQTPADDPPGDAAIAATGTQAAVQASMENLPQEKELEKKEMSSSQDEPPHELENQFILRLPMEHASTVRKMVHSGSSSMKNKLKIDLFSDTRHAVVEVDNVSLAAKLVDLPCVIGSLKTLDRKSFYKTADVSQMLVCTADADVQPSPEEPVTSTDPKAIRKAEKQRKKKYTWKHGITPPLRNVRKRKFRKTIKKVADFKQIEEMDLPVHIESPEVEKEVKRLLCSDAEAVNARWEVIAEDETKEIESQGSIPGYAIASGMSDYKQRHTLPEYYVLQEMRNDSSNNTEEDDKDEEEEEDYDDEEEEDYYDEDMERELQTRFTEYDQYEAKEGTSSMVMEIQKYTQYAEKMLHEIQRRAQRQKDLIRKVENLTLKNHLHSVLEQLKLQEEEKTEQLSYLQEKLNYFLKK
ncbi:transcription initiation factor TFIID subunit 7-like isoform X1 [Bos javanicus]|uniref:transcription initiation factor TFIID subunit 7-like isoform X1 n=2 Tax=Bos javanicus TaxID=9906 RepID=UPI002AA90D8B|nr:transcription initiation factor TFIID subunit 7-like isoform X1 [Bos javanicus]